jgi:hypothetical protein
MAAAMDDRDGNGNDDGDGKGDGDGQGQRQRQWPTAMATATADGDGNGNGNGGSNGNKNSNGNGQWPTAMEMADSDDNGDGDGNSNGNGNCNGNSHGNSNDDVVVRMTDKREGCLFMCRQYAALWQGQCLASPPGHKGVCIAQRCAMGMPLQRVFAPFQGGGTLRAYHGLFFIFFNYLFSLLNIPLCPHTNSVPQEPHQPIDGLPQLLLHFLSW